MRLRKRTIAFATVAFAVATLALVLTLTNRPETATAQQPVNADLPRPMMVTASSNPDGTVDLVWLIPVEQVTQADGTTETVYPEVDGYQVERRGPDETAMSILVNDTGSRYTSYTDSTVFQAGQWRYRVRALRDGERSRPSPSVRINIPVAHVSLPTPPTSAEPVSAAPETDLERANRVLHQTIHGCVPQEVTLPDGTTFWDTETDSTMCVTLRQLFLETCVPTVLRSVHELDNRMFTIVKNDFGTLASLESFGDGRELRPTAKSRDLFLPIQASALTNRPGVLGTKRYINVFSTVDRIDIGHNPETNQHYIYEPSTGEIDPPAPAGTRRDILEFYERLVDIVEGNPYDISPDCMMTKDEPDAISPDRDLLHDGPMETLELPAMALAHLDVGADVDVFMVTLTDQKTHYAAVEPMEHEDAILVTTVPLISDKTLPDTGINITPVFKVTDAAGNVLGSGQDGILEFTPTSAPQDIYVHVSHADENSQQHAGTYKLTVVDDIQDDANTIASVAPGASFTHLIEATGDTDWIRMEPGQAGLYAVSVTSESLEAQITGVYQADGTVESTSWADSGSGHTYEGHAAEDSVYYVAVTSTNGSTGSYTVTMTEDDWSSWDPHHTGTGDIRTESDSVFTGVITNAADADSFDININAGLDYQFTILQPDGAMLPHDALHLSLSDLDPDDDVRIVHHSSDSKDPSFAIQNNPEYRSHPDLVGTDLNATARITVAPGQNASYPVHYMFTAHNPYLVDVDAIDDYPDDLESEEVPTYTMDAEENTLVTITGQINSDGDRDYIRLEGPVARYKFTANSATEGAHIVVPAFWIGGFDEPLTNNINLYNESSINASRGFPAGSHFEIYSRAPGVTYAYTITVEYLGEYNGRIPPDR